MAGGEAGIEHDGALIRTPLRLRARCSGCCPESPISCPYEGLGEKADSQEWLSRPPRNDFIYGLLTVSEERFSARRG